MGANSNMPLHSMSTLPNNIYTNKSDRAGQAGRYPKKETTEMAGSASPDGK